MVTLLSLILQKQNFQIIVDPTNAIFDGDTGNANAQIPKPRVDHQRNPSVYYGIMLTTEPSDLKYFKNQLITITRN
jgi:hypothetical protein